MSASCKQLSGLHNFDLAVDAPVANREGGALRKLFLATQRTYAGKEDTLHRSGVFLLVIIYFTRPDKVPDQQGCAATHNIWF